MPRRFRLSDALAVAALASLGAGTPAPARAFATPSAHGTRHAAATEHHEATLAALAAMEAGGSAVDGAIAAALVLGVVNPGASGLGGGGFAVVWDPKTKSATALDFRERAGAAIDGKTLGVHGAPAGKVGAAIGVPGEPAGLTWLHGRWGKRPLAEDASAAVRLARDGFAIGPHLAGTAATFRARLEDDGELVQALYGCAPGTCAAAKEARPAGSIVRRPTLARTLERFGREGSRVFYQDLAGPIAAAAKRYGGTITPTDLAGYAVAARRPLERTFGGRTVYTMPAPSAGGLMLLETLTLFGADGGSELAKKGFGGSEVTHLLAAGMRGAFADRMATSGDPDRTPTMDEAYKRLLDPGRLSARRARISSDKTEETAAFASREGGTSHLVVVDGEGLVVSMTTTVNSPFGAGVEVPEGGFLLNDELWDFSTADEAAPFLAKGATSPNAPRPLARPVSSMTPTIVVEGGVPILAIGGSGGQRIATGTTQATVCRLVFGGDVGACVAAPRVHIGGPPGLSVEPEMVVDVREGLLRRGETLREEVSHSALSAIALAPGHLWAASDPRKYGFAAAR